MRTMPAHCLLFTGRHILTHTHSRTHAHNAFMRTMHDNLDKSTGLLPPREMRTMPAHCLLVTGWHILTHTHTHTHNAFMRTMHDNLDKSIGLLPPREMRTMPAHCLLVTGWHILTHTHTHTCIMHSCARCTITWTSQLVCFPHVRCVEFLPIAYYSQEDTSCVLHSLS